MPPGQRRRKLPVAPPPRPSARARDSLAAPSDSDQRHRDFKFKPVSPPGRRGLAAAVLDSGGGSGSSVKNFSEARPRPPGCQCQWAAAAGVCWRSLRAGEADTGRRPPDSDKDWPEGFRSSVAGAGPLEAGLGPGICRRAALRPQICSRRGTPVRAKDLANRFRSARRAPAEPGLKFSFIDPGCVIRVAASGRAVRGPQSPSLRIDAGLGRPGQRAD